MIKSNSAGRPQAPRQGWSQHQARLARRAAGLTQEQLSEALSVTPRTIRRWERMVYPPVAIRELYAQTLGVDLDDLLVPSARGGA